MSSTKRCNSSPACCLEKSIKLRPIPQPLKFPGIKLHFYLDCWLFRPSLCRSHPLVFLHLGWVVNFRKSDLTISQQFDFIATQFDIYTFKVVPLPENQGAECSKPLELYTQYRGLGLTQVTGHCQVWQYWSPSGPLCFHPLQWRVAEVSCQKTGDRVALKFDRHLGNGAAEEPVKCQSDWKSLNPSLAASRLREILQ